MTIRKAVDWVRDEMKQLGVRYAELDCPGGVMVVEWRQHEPSEAETALKRGFETAKKELEAEKSGKAIAGAFAERVDGAVWEWLGPNRQETPLNRLISRASLEAKGADASFEELARWAVQMADADRLFKVPAGSCMAGY